MYNLPENYILYSVNNFSEKYFFNAILAYKNYCNRSFDNYKLVVMGVSEALIQSALEAADCSSLKSNIILIKESNKKDLHALYASASILLYPDLNDFLEIPLLKSLVKDIPIISTNDSALIEIAGDAATLVNPMDAKNIGDAITYLLTDFSRKHK
jgi:glycosyltransferase involved in cell wall biosynthesis